MKPTIPALFGIAMFALILAGALELFEQRQPEPPAVGVTDERYRMGVQ